MLPLQRTQGQRVQGQLKVPTGFKVDSATEGLPGGRGCARGHPQTMTKTQIML